MAAPEKDNITESDLFSALGIGGGSTSDGASGRDGSKGGGKASRSTNLSSAGHKGSQRKESQADAKSSSSKSGKKRASDTVGMLDDELLLDIFAPSGTRSSARSSSLRPGSSSTVKRSSDPDVTQARAAQLKEKSIRSRQWKEELERKNRALDSVASVRRASGDDGESASSEAGADVSDKMRSDASRPRAGQPAGVDGSAGARGVGGSGAGSRSKGIVTVKANPVLLEDKATREAREAWSMRGGDARPLQYGRDGGVSAGATPFGAREAHDMLGARQPQRMGDPRDARSTAMPQASQMHQGGPSPYQQPSVQRSQAAGQQRGTQAPYGMASSVQPRGAERAPFAQDARQMPRADVQPYRDSRTTQQPYQRDARSQQAYAQSQVQDASRVSQAPRASQASQMPRASQMPAPSAAPSYQDPRAAATQQPHEPSRPMPEVPQQAPKKTRGKDDPLGIVLIVLAVLCVLVAASLLTGLWDISNL